MHLLNEQMEGQVIQMNKAENNQNNILYRHNDKNVKEKKTSKIKIHAIQICVQVVALGPQILETVPRL